MPWESFATELLLQDADRLRTNLVLVADDPASGPWSWRGSSRSTELSIFGSASDGRMRPDSDVDLLVVFGSEARIGLIDCSCSISSGRPRRGNGRGCGILGEGTEATPCTSSFEYRGTEIGVDLLWNRPGMAGICSGEVAS